MADLLKNIQRLSWRFSGGKSFEPNANDISALNEIITWINREKEERIKHNRHFAKIIVYCYINELNFYKDNAFSERKIQEVLSKPLEYWYDKFSKEMNRKEFNDTVALLGIEDQWEKNKNEAGVFDIEMVRKDAKSNLDLIKENEEKLIKSLNGAWGIEEITSKLNFFITELLNEHGDKE